VAHPRLALPGRGNCLGAQRGRSRRGPAQAGRCADHQGDAPHHLAASQGHPDLQGGLIAVRGHQRQNLAAGHRYYPGRRGVTSGRRDRCAGPSGDRQEQVGDLARASPPAGLGRRPVRRARHSSGRTARHRARTGVGPFASSGHPRHCRGPGVREVGSVCRSSARAGRGTREAAGSVCRSSARLPRRCFAVLAPGSARELTAGLGAPVLLARRRPPSSAAREPRGSGQLKKELTVPLRALRPWPAARVSRHEPRRCGWSRCGWPHPCGREQRRRRWPQRPGPRPKAPKVPASRAVPELAERGLARPE